MTGLLLLGLIGILAIAGIAGVGVHDSRDPDVSITRSPTVSGRSAEDGVER